MATAVDSTRVPAVQARLLPLAPFVFRPLPAVDDPRTADDLLGEIAEEIERQNGTGRPEPLLPAVTNTAEAIRADLDALVADQIANGWQFADAARTLHLRRQLAQAAEHGAALLAALGLPRLVGPDHIVVDPVAAGDALDLAIATLDALDGDADLEPYLAGFYNGLVDPNGEREADSDDEPNLGAPENHPDRFHIDMDGRHHVGRAHHPLGDQTQWSAGGSPDIDEEAVNEDGSDLDHGEMEEGDREPWLGAVEGAQHYRGGDLDLESDGEIERPWWGANASGWNHDGGRYA